MNPSARIGNLLYNEAGEVTEVVSITKTHINGVELSKWRPIPLTEFLYQKSGFSNADNLGGATMANKHISFFRPNGCENFYLSVGDWEEGPYIKTELKHLHQLQNIYFDLTGTDLQIQL